jgi:hypothetical protein
MRKGLCPNKSFELAGGVVQVNFALQSLEQSMAWDEARFGRHYDLVRQQQQHQRQPQQQQQQQWWQRQQPW